MKRDSNVRRQIYRLPVAGCRTEPDLLCDSARFLIKPVTESTDNALDQYLTGGSKSYSQNNVALNPELPGLGCVLNRWF